MPITTTARPMMNGAMLAPGAVLRASVMARTRISRAATNAPRNWARMYGPTLAHGNPRRRARPTLTAGLIWAPLTPPATYTPMTTPKPQAKFTVVKLPKVPGAGSGSPTALRSTKWATTPSPKIRRVKVPRNSANSSVVNVFRRNEQPSLLPPAVHGLLRGGVLPPRVRSCRTVLGHSRAGLLALSRVGYGRITGNRFDEVRNPPLPFAIALLRELRWRAPP